MKKEILAALFCLATFAGSAQTSDRNPYPKTITVNGVAEMELVPDEIYVYVDLKEYDKKGAGKVNLEKIKADFLKSTKSIGLHDTLVTIAAYDGIHGYYPYWMRKKRKDELYASITYQVKFNSSRQMDDLVAKLDDLATQNFYITRTAHSKLETYRRTLKMQAVKAAKEKGQYLTEAIGEQLGDAVTINEPQEYYQPYYNNMREANFHMGKAAATEQAQAADQAVTTDFKKIKLRYDVNVTFALK
jgi:uncharacterized protein YggE